MASQIRPRGYGQPNLKPSLVERDKAKRTRKTAAQKREGNSELHLELIRKLPCIITGHEPAGTAHHLKSGPARKERGLGQKATDEWSLPINWNDHLNGVELVGSTRELAWFQERGIPDPYQVAKSLAAASPDFDRMREIIIANMGHQPDRKTGRSR